nr:hypothetical protein [Desulfobacula sp.]
MFKSRREERKIQVEKDALVSLGRGDYEIGCISGVLWVTWPGSGDRILCAGDRLCVSQTGKICITSKAGALMRVQKRRILPSFKDLPGLAAARFFRAGPLQGPPSRWPSSCR